MLSEGMLDGADTPSTCSSLLSRRQYNDNVVDTGRSLCHVTVSYGATDVCEDAKLSLDRGSAASVSTVGEGQMDDATVVQAGVQGIEAVGKAWTKTSLGVAYAGYVLLWKSKDVRRVGHLPLEKSTRNGH